MRGLPERAGIAEGIAAHRGASRADPRDGTRRLAQPKRAHPKVI